MVGAMPGESPGQTGQHALLEPESEYLSPRKSWWKALGMIAFAIVTLVWLFILPNSALRVPHVGFLVWMAELPLLLTVLAVILLRLKP